MGTDTTNNTATAETKPAEVPVPPGHEKFAFHFRKEKIRDEKGAVIGEGKKLPSLEVVFPVPSDEDLINFIAKGGKEKEFLREVVNDAIKLAARGQINELREANPEATITPDMFKLDALTFTAIANMDKRDRAVEIPEEVFASFYEDYKSVLTALGTAPERVNKHIVLFKSQFRTARYDKPALGVLKDRLNMYAAKTENMEDNGEVFNFLMNKVEKYLKADEKNLIEAL